MPQVDTFSQLLVARDRDGGFFELLRNELEVVCPAFDATRQCMVELHIYHSDGVSGPDPDVLTRQARSAARIHHPNAAAVYDFGEDEGACFYISEFIDGEMLEAYLDRCAPLPEAVALRLALDATRGLAACAAALPVLAGMDLLQSRVQLTGRSTNTLTLKVGGYRFGSRKAETLPAAGVHNYYIRSLAEVLLWAITGRQIGVDELTIEESRKLSPPVLTLLNAMEGSRPSIKTLEGAAAAVDRAFDALASDTSITPGLEEVPASLTPLLPLDSYFVTTNELAAYLGEDYPLQGDPRDARTPLRMTTVDSDGGQKGTLQLLPTDDILPESLLQNLQAALRQGNALDQPNLIRMLAYWPSENAGFFIEEDAGHITLEDAIAWKGAFTPEETLLVLNQMESADTQAKTCGLRAAPRGTGQIVIHFLDREFTLTDATIQQLAMRSLTEWPLFRIKVRTYPTFLALLRCPPDLARQNRNSTGAEAIDFAWWARQMLGSDTTASKQLAGLVNDVASGRAGAMIHTSAEFLQAFRSLADAPSSATRDTFPHAPASGPGSAATDLSSIDARSTGPPRARRPIDDETADQFESEQGDHEDEDDEEETVPPPGLAEVLFREGGEESVPSAPHAEIEIRLPSPLQYDEDAWPTDEADGDDYDSLDDHGQQPASTLWLMLVVIVIALLLAAVFAHLSGLAFWLR